MLMSGIAFWVLKFRVLGCRLSHCGLSLVYVASSILRFEELEHKQVANVDTVDRNVSICVEEQQVPF